MAQFTWFENTVSKERKFVSLGLFIRYFPNPIYNVIPKANMIIPKIMATTPALAIKVKP